MRNFICRGSPSPKLAGRLDPGIYQRGGRTGVEAVLEPHMSRFRQVCPISSKWQSTKLLTARKGKLSADTHSGTKTGRRTALSLRSSGQCRGVPANPLVRKLARSRPPKVAPFKPPLALDVFDPLKQLADDVLRAGGIDIQAPSDGSAHVSVPFTPETMPSSEEQRAFMLAKLAAQ